MVPKSHFISSYLQSFAFDQAEIFRIYVVVVKVLQEIVLPFAGMIVWPDASQVCNAVFAVFDQNVTFSKIQMPQSSTVSFRELIENLCPAETLSEIRTPRIDMQTRRTSPSSQEERMKHQAHPQTAQAPYMPSAL